MLAIGLALASPSSTAHRQNCCKLRYLLAAVAGFSRVSWSVMKDSTYSLRTFPTSRRHGPGSLETRPAAARPQNRPQESWGICSVRLGPAETTEAGLRSWGQKPPSYSRDSGRSFQQNVQLSSVGPLCIKPCICRMALRSFVDCLVTRLGLEPRTY